MLRILGSSRGFERVLKGTIIGHEREEKGISLKEEEVEPCPVGALIE